MIVLMLVDGDGLLYRAANAIPYFTNTRGLPTNGLQGFAAMMWGLRRNFRPSHMAVAFTADPPLVKHSWDPDYKINLEAPRHFSNAAAKQNVT